MLRLYHKFLLLPIGIYLSLGLPALAANVPVSSSYYERDTVKAFMQDLEVRDRFDRSFLEEVFTEARHKPKIIQAMDRPFKQPPPWYQYAPPLLSEARLNQGLEFWETHGATLKRAEEHFGVPAQIIVSIIGIETFYGKVTGNYRLIDALSTLAFDYPRRSAFFQEELRNFLLMARDEGLNPVEVRGSFAGAIGLPQFMPSSYRRFGIDFDRNGHVDLWASPEDAIGSVANFLREHGWRADSWDVRAIDQLSLPFIEQQTAEKGVSEWRTRETWQKLLETPIIWPENSRADDVFALMRLDTTGDIPFYAWIGPNFQAITRYNRSRLYASAVWSLACQLAEARGQGRCQLRLPI